MKKLVAAMLCLALSLMCAVGLANEKIDPSELQIGVIMIGDTSDMGFNYSLCQSKRALPLACPPRIDYRLAHLPAPCRS